MNPRLLEIASRLAAERIPYALASVVRREAPTSAQVGDAALVTADGRCLGWVGGSCTRPTVVREALAALADGEPRLIALDPDPAAPRPDGGRVLPMTCHSRGRVDVYIEPILPAPALYVFGVAPAARALARLGAAMGYRVTAVDPDADADAFPDAAEVRETLDVREGRADAGAVGARAPRFAVVATQGQWDEGAAAQALGLHPDYLGVIASARRFDEIRAHLRGAGFDADAIARISNPAGLDIGARTAEEIAVSILAEVVRTLRGAAHEPADEDAVTAAMDAEPATAATAEPAASKPIPRAGAGPERALPLAGAGPVEAVDPVCGMAVVVGPGTPRVEHEGRIYHFCCGHCRERFLRDPAAHAARVET